MLRQRAYFLLFVVLVLTSVTLFTGVAFGQSAPGPQLSKSEVTTPEPKPTRSENKVAAEDPQPNDLKSEVETLKAENAAVRELLQKMAEQQKALLDQVELLQKRIDGTSTANVQPSGGSQLANDSVPLTNAANPSQPTSTGEPRRRSTNRRKRIVIRTALSSTRIPTMLRCLSF